MKVMCIKSKFSVTSGKIYTCSKDYEDDLFYCIDTNDRGVKDCYYFTYFTSTFVPFGAKGYKQLCKL